MIGPKLNRKVEYITDNERMMVIIPVRKMRKWEGETEIKIFENWNMIKSSTVQRREKTSCHKKCERYNQNNQQTSKIPCKEVDLASL